MPSLNPTIRGNNLIVWGTDELDPQGNIGIITRGNSKRTSDKVEIKDNNGYTVTVVYFNERNETSIEIVYQGTATLPEIGDDVTIAGIPCICDNTEIVWEQAGVKKFTLNATKYDGVTE